MPKSKSTYTKEQKYRVDLIKSYMKDPNKLVSESVDSDTGTAFLDYSNPSRDCLFRIAVDRQGKDETSYLR